MAGAAAERELEEQTRLRSTDDFKEGIKAMRSGGFRIFPGGSGAQRR
jgi:hypothetical protein